MLVPPDPKAYNEIMSMKGKLPTNQWLSKLEKVLLKHPDWREVRAGPEPYNDVDYVGNLISMAVEYVDSIPMCQELVDSIIREAEELIETNKFFRKIRTMH